MTPTSMFMIGAMIVLVTIAILFKRKILFWENRIIHTLKSLHRPPAPDEEIEEGGHLPHCALSKSWEVDGSILGSLALNASAEDSETAYKNLKRLIKLSLKHDDDVSKKNQKQENDSIG